MYFESNIRLTLNKCFLRAYYMINTVRDTWDAIINKTKKISSLCGASLHFSCEGRLGLVFKKYTNMPDGLKKVNRHNNCYEENKQGMSFRVGISFYFGFERLF